MNFKKLFSLFFIFPLLSKVVSAHCPLCTAGAGVAAVGAVYLGVNKIVVMVFIGALGVSMGWWFARIIKKKIIPYQGSLLILGSFFLTVLPILPMFTQYSPLYLSFWGDYGKTLVINLALITSILGGMIVCISPWLSKKLSRLREGKLIPFQGVSITILLLLITGVIIQLIA